MTRLLKYDAYVDSGIDRLGLFPEHWSVCKLKDIASYQEGPGIMADDFVEDGVPLIRISGMKGSTVSLDGCNFLDPLKVRKKWEHFKLKFDELVVSASATTGIAAKVNKETVGAIPYTGLIRFKPRSKVNVDYLQYFLTANIFTNQIDLQKSGTTIQHYGPTHLGRVLAVLPPLPEQKAIADYLDTQTAQIDRKVDLLTQKAAQYGKLKQSLINETVTRGLDKSVAMKDSGVEWIGEVPEHWNVRRLKDIISLATGDTAIIKSDTGMYPIYGANGIIGMCDSYNQKENRILIGRVGTSGAITEAVGKYVVSDNALIVTLTKHVVYKFMLYKLIALKLEHLSSKNAQPLLTGASVKKLLSSFPPYKEQKTIANYLDDRTAQIDRIVETIHTQSDKHKELRKTLINDVVTGKIKVVLEGKQDERTPFAG